MRTTTARTLLQDWWYTTLLEEKLPPPQPLTESLEADVLVIGGGAAGLAAAMRLSEAGRDVVLLERNICGGSSTGKSAGFLTPDSELELYQLIRRFGVEGARDLWGAAQHGIDLMVERVHRYGLDCDLIRQDSLFLAKGKSGLKDVREEVAARKEMGFSTRAYTREEIPGILGGRGYDAAVRYEGTYGINPLLFAQGMKRVLVERGVRVFEASTVYALHERVATTHLGRVRANEVVVCADKIPRALSPYADRTYHAQTFLSISEPLEESEARRMFPETPLQCWDSDLVYSYWRLTGDRRLLLGGGSALTTFSKDDVTSDRVIGKVVRDFKMHFPEVCGLHFMQFWPGRIDTTRDLIPTVLRDPKNPWAHFVLGCVGLPWATFCGDFVAGQILGDAADREQVYYQYFSDDRRFFVPLAAERLMGKRLVFSLNNAWAKYYQVDRRPIQGPAPSAERTVSLVKESGTAEIQSPPRAERKAP